MKVSHSRIVTEETAWKVKILALFGGNVLSHQMPCEGKERRSQGAEKDFKISVPAPGEMSPHCRHRRDKYKLSFWGHAQSEMLLK